MVKRLLPLIAATALFASAAHAQVPPPGQLVSGWTGSVTKQIKTDSSGRLEVIGSASGGPSYGPDAVNTAPTQPPLSMGCFASSGGPTPVTSGRMQYVNCDLSGRPNVNINGTATVSGTVAATQSGTWNINNISGTISLPTGAATAANQVTEIASLATIATNSGTISTNTAPASAGTLSTVACSTSSTQVLPSNASRKKATIFFDGVPTVYVTQSSTAASSTTFTLKATDGGYYEITDYTGEINAICSAATGNLRVTSIQ